MHYGLRVNHHADDHGRLIYHGIRPALARMRSACGPVPAALRPHWRDGPHLLIGLELPPDASAERAWSILETEIQSWLDDEPAAPPLDPDAYDRLSRSLAEQEAIAQAPLSLRADNMVERGSYAVPAPLDVPSLAPLRDAFSASALDDVFALVGERLADPERALLGWVRRVVCLERLKWRGDLRLWPLSPQGQSLLVTRTSGKAARDFPALAARLEPLLVAMVEQEGLLRGEARLSEESRRWLATAQESYDRLLDYVDRADPSFFEAIDLETRRGGPSYSSEVLGMGSDRMARLLSNPTHFAFRMLINFIYGMLPSVGFSASRRFFACYLVTHMLETHYPEVMSRATSDGLKL
ncbi:MAG TPA: hypothetical protein VMS43_15080 [Allosphingosinicella sp.]|nr:hypothetical protein [Allosphingosinicella sp.]